MPAAAGDGLGESPSRFLAGEKPPVQLAESFLPACVSSVSRETLRTFQHTKRVGSYLIGRKLGEGSFAKVREGLHVGTGEKVAIKVIDKKKAKKDTYVTKNLRREGQIQQMIRHPNITQLLDILETENSYYLVMELCTGGNLMHKIYERKRIEEHEARKYIRQLILAVEHLHRAGVVHRDLKIENLLLDENNNIKLIDFGLSNCAGILGYTDPFSTQCGSPAYAAPELLARKKYGPKVDVWSIGVNMYAMLTGTLPFTVEPFSLRALYQKMVDKDMNPLPTHLSPAAISFLRSLLEPDPLKRPNIQQALANRWLNDNYHGKGLHTYPNRIHLEDLSQSVVLHMSEKLGYKHSDVINVILSNRACHTLAVYFLLNRKLENYLLNMRKPDINDNVCHKNQFHQLEKYKMNKNSYEERRSKDLEKRGEQQQQQQRAMQRKLEKCSPSHRQSNCLTPQGHISKGPVKERRSSKSERESFGGLSPFHEVRITKPGCMTSCSLEYLEMQSPDPRTPKIMRRQDSHSQETVNVNMGSRIRETHLNVVRSFESVNREDQIESLSPNHQYRVLGSPVSFSPRHSSERILSPIFQFDNTSPIKGHSNQASFTYDDKSSPSSPESMSPTSPHSPHSPSCNNNISGNLGSPNCVRSRGRFPMMGIGQMLRKRNQVVSPKAEKPLETRMPALHQMSPGYASFNSSDMNGFC
ncbi:hormonally up-regulated neu tumor-associated kinase homolog [Xenopus tropicalis]|uniref:Hormonally up-regulated neu tumor-associated kinase homolog n=2 Tax=Xenopus tropicalis TaxID=8364 RepID=HUNK_XENTR|nr:hormonally up-regulated neu tumor-associated kinase homolog [Xenopus tropicalis]B1WAS2.1 RecName: Full=Hormonally up-regulated neu tumor-associated kinase homolog; AltName: Full=Serine/threonine-protein kinase MAK-V [Xenopus tropicalis]AAI61479.1 hunk protein [Xenopus tropicalis]|eukprot:NP_001120549.1 hormonally up-regulated neu tumor-associated kinase homolog [Xenopus tropicalis]